MPKIIDYELNAEQLSDIELAMTSDERPEVRQRATALRLLHLGFVPSEVAVMLKVGRATIHYWRQRWLEEGVDGLANKPKPGRPPKTDASYRQVLEATLERDPAEYGYAFSLWTLDRLRAHLAQQTGMSLSKERFRALMKRYGYVYRRPKKTLRHAQDGDAREHAKALIEELKKGRNQVKLSSSLWTKRR